MTQAREARAGLKPVSRSTITGSGAGPSGSTSGARNGNGTGNRSDYESDTIGGRQKETEHTGGGNGSVGGSGGAMGIGGKKVKSPKKVGSGGKKAASRNGGGTQHPEESIDEEEEQDSASRQQSIPPPQAPNRLARARTPVEALLAITNRPLTKFFALNRNGQDPSTSGSGSFGGADISYTGDGEEEEEESRFGTFAERSTAGSVVGRGGIQGRGGGEKERDMDESSMLSGGNDSQYQWETSFVNRARVARMEKDREGSVAGSATGRGSRPPAASGTKGKGLAPASPTISNAGRRNPSKQITMTGRDRAYKPGDTVPHVRSDDSGSSADEDPGEGIASHLENRNGRGQRRAPDGPGYLGGDLSFDPNDRSSRRRRSGRGGRGVDENGVPIEGQEGMYTEGNEDDDQEEEENGSSEDDDGSAYDEAGEKMHSKVRGSPRKRFAANGKATNSKGLRQPKPALLASRKAEQGRNQDDDDTGLQFDTDEDHHDAELPSVAKFEQLSVAGKIAAIVSLLFLAPIHFASSLVSTFVLRPIGTLSEWAGKARRAMMNGQIPSWLALAALLPLAGMWFLYIKDNAANGSSPMEEWNPSGGSKVSNKGWSKPYIPAEGETTAGVSSEVLDNLVNRLKHMERALEGIDNENKALKAYQRGFEIRMDANQASEAEATRLANEKREREYQTFKHDASDLRAQIGELSKSVQKVGTDASRHRSAVDDRFDAHTKQVNRELGEVRVKVAQLEDQVRESLTETKWLAVLERVLPSIVPVRTNRNTGNVEIDPKLWTEMKRVLTTKADVESIARKAVSSANIAASGKEVIAKIPTWRDFLEENEDELREWSDRMFDRNTKSSLLLGRDHFLQILHQELEILREQVKADAQAQEIKLTHLVSSRSSSGRPSSVKPSSPVIISSQDGQNVTGLFEDLIDAAILRYSKDTIARTDYALASTGGQVIQSLTTPALSLHTPRFWKYAFLGSKIVRGRGPLLALHPDNTPGMCWAFSGSKGDLGVMLSRRIVVTDVTIEHAPMELVSGMTLKSAPKDIQVWALLEDQQDLAIYRDYLNENEYAREAAALHSDTRPSLAHVLLSSLTYDPYLHSSPSHIQTFPVNPDFVHLGLKTQSVVFKILDNWGSEEGYTCLYRVRVHGEAEEDEV